jgi:DmsE family decaheme c-type cytochrome
MRRLMLTVVFIVAVSGYAAAQEEVSMSTCAVCHEDVASAFAASVHGAAMAARSTEVLESSCVSCHGPAAEHVDDPSSENIRRVPDVDSCASCHSGSLASLSSTTASHARFDVECLDCHGSGHEASDAPHLLRKRAADLCSSCHQIEAAAFRQPFAHRDGTRSFSCLNCHSIHGLGSEHQSFLRGPSAACVSCHTEKEGPFVFSHPPRELDGCITCHEPHGSPNPRQLRRRHVRSLCLECHADVPAFHDVSRPRYQKCQSCHAAVHGSNRDPRLIEE